MADSETPMYTQREVRQRRRGLYWLVALFALIVLVLATFGLTEGDLSEWGARVDSGTEAPVVEGTVGGS